MSTKGRKGRDVPFDTFLTSMDAQAMGLLEGECPGCSRLPEDNGISRSTPSLNAGRICNKCGLFYLRADHILIDGQLRWGDRFGVHIAPVIPWQAGKTVRVTCKGDHPEPMYLCKPGRLGTALGSTLGDGNVLVAWHPKTEGDGVLIGVVPSDCIEEVGEIRDRPTTGRTERAARKTSGGRRTR